MIVTLLPNRTGRDFILGDLHGAFPFLQALLSHAHFDEHHDRLIATGDLFDRGRRHSTVSRCQISPGSTPFAVIMKTPCWHGISPLTLAQKIGRGKDRPARW
jgi:hypothetical protein